MAGISASTLTTAGFSAGTAGAGNSGGTNYTLSVNAAQILVTLFTEPEPGGQTTTFAGVAYVYPNGDVSAADAATIAGKLATIGLKSFATWPNTNVELVDIGVNNAGGTPNQPAYSIAF